MLRYPKTVKIELPSLAVAMNEAEMSAFFPAKAREELLRAYPHAVLFNGNTSRSLSSFLEAHHSQVMLSCWSTPPLVAPLPPHLSYVCHITGSVRNLVPRLLIENGLVVTNWGDGAAETVAEGILMLILASYRRTQHWGREMHDRGGWRTDFGKAQTLFDRKVAIHGFGRVARALVPLLKPFRVEVDVYSEGVPSEYISEHGATPRSTLAELFRNEPDIVVEIEALTPQSRFSVRDNHFRLMKAGSLFVNSGRGGVVDETALERHASEGRIDVALDVYSVEPLPVKSPLRGLPNVTLMPHLGGPTQDRFQAIGRFAFDNLRRWRDDENLEAVVDLKAYDSST